MLRPFSRGTGRQHFGPRRLAALVGFCGTCVPLFYEVGDKACSKK